MTYPEHEKLEKVAEKSDWLGEFLEWMQNKGICFAEYRKFPASDGRSEFLLEKHISTNQILAEYFDIDLKKLDSEKNEMIMAIKNACSD